MSNEITQAIAASNHEALRHPTISDSLIYGAISDCIYWVDNSQLADETSPKAWEQLWNLLNSRATKDARIAKLERQLRRPTEATNHVALLNESLLIYDASIECIKFADGSKVWFETVPKARKQLRDLLVVLTTKDTRIVELEKQLKGKS
jgi:hypothetical protein